MLLPSAIECFMTNLPKLQSSDKRRSRKARSESHRSSAILRVVQPGGNRLGLDRVGSVPAFRFRVWASGRVSLPAFVALADWKLLFKSFGFNVNGWLGYGFRARAL